MNTPIENLTDEEITERRLALPKYKNDMTVEQSAESSALYAEQRRRYKERIKATATEYNKAATGATGLKHGDKVEFYVPGLFGAMGLSEKYQGKVIYDKKGRLSIRTTFADGSGRKTFSINKAWKKTVTT